MPRKFVTFERARLFEEVWSEPLTTLAKRYGLEAADLRVATVVMDIPRPSSGHWTQVEYGKARPKPELPQSGAPTTYEHAWDEPAEGASARQRRVRRVAIQPEVEADAAPQAPAAAAPEVTPPTMAPAAAAESLPPEPELEPPAATRSAEAPVSRAVVALPPMATSLDQCLPLVRAMATRLKKAFLDQRKFPAIRGAGIFQMAVSSGNQLRALLTLDRVVRHCKAMGLKLVTDEALKKPAFFALEGQELTLRVFESGRQVPNELTPLERAKLKVDPDAYLYRDKYVFVPTNILKLEVREVGQDWTRFTLVETKTRPLAECLVELPDRLQAVATERRRLDEERKESARRYAAAEAKRAAQRAHRKAELEKLERFEDMANRLVRARRLRELLTVLEGTGALQGDDPAAQLQWLAEAADWLDPTVRRPWPEVDEVDPRPY